tara:strand:- start:2712 stop:3506 length:795 start_codon:yes stop_codon:yes gene_type:complete
MKKSYLTEILKAKKDFVERKKKKHSITKEDFIKSEVQNQDCFLNALKASIDTHQFAVVAEMKRASPSQGLIRQKYDPSEIAKQYLDAKASCLSILTDENFFQGSLDHLSIVKKLVDLPVLRKDFIVDKFQIFESQKCGADCILLIVAALSKDELHEFNNLALGLGMEVLIEVHNEQELEIALDLKPKIIGINNRNLETFEVNLETTKRLSQQIPNEILVISESGIKKSKDIESIISCGVNAFLVGEAFMRAQDPGRELKKLFFT